MNVSIVNYGMGNTFSIKHAIENLGFDVSIANNPSEIEQAQKKQIRTAPPDMASQHIG